MECEGLNGLWKACPPTTTGLSEMEATFFGVLFFIIIVGLIGSIILFVVCVNRLIN